MNIIWIVESGGLSGGVRVLLEYATRIAKRGHKCTIASLDYQPKWFDCSNVDWWVFPSYDVMMPHVKKIAAKKVATWWKTAHWLLDGVNEGEGYYLVQDIESSYYFRPIERLEAEKTYALGYKMFTPNAWVTSQLKDVTCVGQAYDANVYKTMKYAYPAKNRVITIARRQALKGYSQLGELSRYLAVMDKNVALWTFGQDQGVKLVGAFANNLVNIPDRDVIRLYSEGTVYVSTSVHEGFGLPMLEAMACACPVITTDSDGNYFCKNDENCLKYDKMDMWGVADGAIRTMKDEVLRKRLVEGGLETAKQFSDWDKVIDKLEAFFGG